MLKKTPIGVFFSVKGILLLKYIVFLSDNRKAIKGFSAKKN